MTRALTRAGLGVAATLVAFAVGAEEPRPMPAARTQPETTLPGTAPPEARATTVAEPAGYRSDPYRAPVPETLTGAEVVGDVAAHALWHSGRVPFVDVMPTPVRPPDLPEGTFWRDPPRESIKGAVWLPNTGYDALDDATQGYFFASLALLTKGDKDAPLVFFCMRDCWMSWNAGKRAIDSGYGRVFWYPGGSDGWAAAHWPTERIHPFQP